MTIEPNRLVQFHLCCPKCGTEHVIPERLCDSIVAATGAPVDAQHQLADIDLDSERRWAEVNCG